MKTYFNILALLFLSNLAVAQDHICFSMKPVDSLDEKACGQVMSQVDIKDCATSKVTRSFKTLVGFNCKEQPPTLNLKYQNQMLVGELSRFEGLATYFLSRTYVRGGSSRSPASIHGHSSRGDKCFTMVPKETPDPESCSSVVTTIQMKDCKTHEDSEPAFQATAHYSCHDKNQKLKYWYRDAMLVGVLEESKEGYRVKKTYSLVYPEVYGVY
jgi:hypothetical protein